MRTSAVTARLPTAEAAPAPQSAASGAAADADAARRVLAGEREAFNPLVRRHMPRVFHHLRRMVRSHETAEDLTQETFARAFRSLASWDPKRPFAPWVLTIATRLALDELRRGGRMVSLDAALEENPHAEPGEPPRAHVDAAASEDQRRLEKALSQLPPETRAMVELHYREDLPLHEIARGLGKRTGAVKTALHRARRRLRALLEEEEKDVRR